MFEVLSKYGLLYLAQIHTISMFLSLFLAHLSVGLLFRSNVNN